MINWKLDISLSVAPVKLENRSFYLVKITAYSSNRTEFEKWYPTPIGSQPPENLPPLVTLTDTPSLPLFVQKNCAALEFSLGTRFFYKYQ